MAIIKKPDDSSLSRPILDKGKLKAGRSASPFQQRVNQAKAVEHDASTFPNRICLMLDFSSSMSTMEKDNKTRFELLRDAVDNFIQRCNFVDTAIALRSFPPKLEVALTTNPVVAQNMLMGSFPAGGTPLRQCVERCLEDVPMTRAVIVSDGQAADWYDFAFSKDYVEEVGGTHSILDRYKQAGIPIDCVHISADSAGEDLLRRIAAITGGIFIKFTDVSAFASAFGFLAPTYRAMLTSGQVTAEQIGAREVK